MTPSVIRRSVGGVILSVFFVLGGCGMAYRGIEGAMTDFSNSSFWHYGRHGSLTEREEAWAETAWLYFENNYNPQTGFVNATDRYPVVSMWHVADYIAALYCAQILDLIDEREFDERFSVLLHRLNTMPLAFERLPNRLYNAQSGAMVNDANTDEETGWSIIDMGRLLFWLSVIKSSAPQFSEFIDRIVLRYSFCDAVDEEGRLFSARAAA